MFRGAYILPSSWCVSLRHLKFFPPAVRGGGGQHRAVSEGDQGEALCKGDTWTLPWPRVGTPAQPRGKAMEADSWPCRGKSPPWSPIQVALPEKPGQPRHARGEELCPSAACRPYMGSSTCEWIRALVGSPGAPWFPRAAS